ncbi:hypothetical protein QUF70_03370 [Desulfobacterales bacterium HSG17]|nr:hypothetical protein [Desulfobacterales bacterium HSG17]
MPCLLVETDETRIENMGDRNQGSAEDKIRKYSDLIMGNCKLDDKSLIILESTLLLNKIQKVHEKEVYNV